MPQADPAPDGVPAAVRAAALKAFDERDDAVLLLEVDPHEGAAGQHVWVDPAGGVRLVLRRQASGQAVLDVSPAPDSAPSLQGLAGVSVSFGAAPDGRWSVATVPTGPVSVLVVVAGVFHRTSWTTL